MAKQARPISICAGFLPSQACTLSCQAACRIQVQGLASRPLTPCALLLPVLSSWGAPSVPFVLHMLHAIYTTLYMLLSRALCERSTMQPDTRCLNAQAGKQ